MNSCPEVLLLPLYIPTLDRLGSSYEYRHASVSIAINEEILVVLRDSEMAKWAMEQICSAPTSVEGLE